MSCIYCDGPGPFTDEHVISAGIGGDDLAWLLKGCVCGDCNTKIFSKLETKVLRSSPVALARLFLQSRTRDRGSKTSNPSIQPQVSYHEDKESGLLLEQELQAAGQPVILPQLIFQPPGQLLLFAVDTASAEAFRAALSEALDDEITVVEKVRDGFELRYDATRLAWKDDVYVETSTESSAKPPRENLVWFEDALRPATVCDEFALPPRLYQRPGGQIVCRANAREHVVALLTLFRQNLPTIPERAPTKADHAPGVHCRMSIDLQAHDRFLVRTGVNLCAYLFGPDFVRHAAFGRTRDYARTGNGAVYKVPPDKTAGFQHAFGPALAHHHVLMLMAGPGKADEKACIVLLSRFYGGPIESTRLAEFDGPAPDITAPIVIIVDYQAHRIQRMSLEDYATFALQNAFKKAG